MKTVSLDFGITEGAAEERILFHLLMTQISDPVLSMQLGFFFLTDVLLTGCDGFHGGSMEVPWTMVKEDIYIYIYNS